MKFNQKIGQNVSILLQWSPFIVISQRVRWKLMGGAEEMTKKWGNFFLVTSIPILLGLAGLKAQESVPPAEGSPVGVVREIDVPEPVPENQGPPRKGPSDLGVISDGSFAAMLGPRMGMLRTGGSFKVDWFPEQDVVGQTGGLGWWAQDFSVLVPLAQDTCWETFATANVRSLLFRNDAILLPNTLQPFPDDLWNLRLGLGGRYRLANEWIVGANLSIGSASDQPFHGIEEMLATVQAFLRVPSGETNAWLFSVFYSPTSEITFPIPGVAYVCQPTENLRAVLGIPFVLMYRPVEDLSFSFFYLPVRTVKAQAGYRLAPPLRLYVGYDWGNEGYFLVDRPDDRDRLYYYDMRITVGVQVFASRHFFVDLHAGYAFERFFFEGQNYDDRNFNRVDVGNGPFGGLQSTLRW